MSTPDVVAETARQASLDSYGILDTEPEAGFDSLTRLAAQLFQVPIAIVSLVDAGRQWFKSRVGLAESETPRDVSFCAHAVREAATLVVRDTTVDPRFETNRLVTGAPHIRFYAGAPLRTEDGHILGTLCVIDRRPRDLRPDEIETLELLANQAMAQLEIRRQRHQLAVERNALRASQQAFQKSEARLSALFRGLSESVLLQNPSGRIEECNPAAERMVGRSRAQMLGHSLTDAGWRLSRLDGRPIPDVEHPTARALATGEPTVDLALRLHKPSGEQRRVRLNVQPLAGRADGVRDGVISTFRDSTMEDLAEEALARDQDLLSVILANLPGMTVTLFDAALRIVRTFGFHGAAPFAMQAGPGALGTSVLNVMGIASPALEQALRGCLRGESSRLEIAREGRRFVCRMVPVHLDASNPGLLLVQDVTEIEVLRESIARQQRLVTTGTLAAGVGHEINNPLAFVGANVDYVLEELRSLAGASPSGRMQGLTSALVDARDGVERIRKIVRGLRTLARQDDTPTAVALHATLEISANMASHEVRARANLAMELLPVPPVLGDEALLSQVFVNLIVNAAQAFRTADVEQNRITVRCFATETRVVVEVLDNGPGIAPDVLPHIFDPFFTTKPVGLGTGLGLSISHGLVTSLGGEIVCESTLGEGTVFRVMLPLAPDGPVPGRRLTLPAPHDSSRGRILLLDDEEGILRATERILRTEHDVVAVSDSREGLRLLLAPEADFDVIFCDLMMPRLTGMDLFALVQECKPDLAARFVFVTGGTTGEDTQTFLGSVANEHVEKPFSNQALRKLARRFVTKRGHSLP